MSLPSLAKNMAGEVKRSMDHSFPTTLWENGAQCLSACLNPLSSLQPYFLPPPQYLKPPSWLRADG